MTRRYSPRRPLLSFLRLLWMQPLWAVPFALFFGTIFGSGPRSYLVAYEASVVFAYTIGVAIWALESFVVGPRRPVPGESRRFALWAEVLGFTVTAIAASYCAAFLLDLTLMPGFLGTGRAIVISGMFALVFSVLVTGIVYAYHFYHQALDRARSDQELVTARRIQRSFLLSQFPTLPRFEVHAANISSKQVSGDFYDVVPAGEDQFLLAIADVAGKGVPAALMSSMLQASLRTQAATVTSVAAILRNVNALVYRSTATHQFATFFLGRVDERSLTLSYSNAGHNFPVVFRSDGTRLNLERGGTVVGVLESADYEEDHVTLLPGDRVVFYTDGINEAASSSGEQFGEARLCELVESLPTQLPAREVVDRVLEGVRTFLDGVDPADDMTLMVLRVLGPLTEGQA